MIISDWGAAKKSVQNYFIVNDIDLIVSDDEAFLKILDQFVIHCYTIPDVVKDTARHAREVTGF